MSFTIIGTGSSLPEKVVTNDELSTIMDTNDEWIRTRTGIRQRHICTHETLTDLATDASQKALENAGIEAKDLDLIICATLRGDYVTPSTACVIQMNLGASCPAFDINAACPGFIYAMDVAAGYFARGRVKKVLIVACEAMSRLLDWQDRSTCVLFGDAAGAVVLGEGDDLLSIKITASGSLDTLKIPVTLTPNPFCEEEVLDSKLYMKGQDVYKFAVTASCKDLKEVIKKAGVTQMDIDHVLLHQANLRIIETAKTHLKIPPERYAINIQNTGNTSASSIIIILDEMNRQGKLKAGELLAMSAFGAGLTTGACVMRWNKP